MILFLKFVFEKAGRDLLWKIQRQGLSVFLKSISPLFCSFVTGNYGNYKEKSRGPP